MVEVGMDVWPLRTEQDYEAALAEIERLMDAKPGTPEYDKLDVLSTLVEVYEEEHYPVPLPNPIGALEFHMERLGLSRRDLEPYIGSRGRVSEILNRKRPLTLRMIRNLEKGLGIPAAILVQEYALADEEQAVGQQDADSVTAQHDRIKAETEAGYELPSEERARYAGQFVAVHEGRVVDTDSDRSALYARVRERFGRQPILITEGGEAPSPGYTVHSARSGRV